MCYDPFLFVVFLAVFFCFGLFVVLAFSPFALVLGLPFRRWVLATGYFLFVSAGTAWVLYVAVVYIVLDYFHLGAWAGCVGALPVTEVVAAASSACLSPAGHGLLRLRHLFALFLLIALYFAVGVGGYVVAGLSAFIVLCYRMSTFHRLIYFALLFLSVGHILLTFVCYISSGCDALVVAVGAGRLVLGFAGGFANILLHALQKYMVYRFNLVSVLPRFGSFYCIYAVLDNAFPVLLAAEVGCFVTLFLEFVFCLFVKGILDLQHEVHLGVLQLVPASSAAPQCLLACRFPGRAPVPGPS